MAKGQKHGNREVKKPKGTGKKVVAGSAVSPFQTPTKPLPTKAAQARRNSDTTS